ncbi:DUF2570 domain-containing protein [Marinobacter pelagius]|uniref:Uncharacterized protein n=1 Tax=Marinobacter pelagius TaxID=379482 RepID=A0A1I4T4J9_9GAMM|nr:DUF2570 domain-containing protein [Marinobacter pelagius]SFM71684.1 Protein of unknown function [Marinobacter pelagius]
MISEAIKAKLAPWVIGGALVLLGILAGTIAWLMAERDQLLADVAKMGQALNQAKVTNAENQNRIDELQADIQWRDQKALERQQRQRQQARQLAAVQSELEEALKDAPCSGPDYLWPDAVFERMREDTVSDEDGSGPAGSASPVPGTNTDPGTAKPAN